MLESNMKITQSPILSLRDVSVIYRNANLFSKKSRIQRPAINSVSFDLPAKGTIGIVGESGCGKSTIAKAILMIINPVSGVITFNGHNQAYWQRRKKKFYSQVQLIWQDPFSSINPKMRIKEIISRPLSNFYSLNKNEINQRLNEIIVKVGLTEEHLEMYPHELSGGGRQRITIARALISEPSLLIADEPTSALDVSIQAQILNLMRELKDEMSLSMVFISHNISVVNFLCDTIIVMYMGHIVEQAPRETLINHYRHWYTALLFESIPRGPVSKELKFSIDLGELEICDSGCPFAPRCIRADDICFRVKPKLEKIGIDHLCACHHYK